MTNIIAALEAERMKREVPEFGPGDTVVVEVKVKEGDRERVQAYEGVVIAKSNRGLNSSFTVRKISHGEGVERVFQLHSPTIADISVKFAGNVTLPAARLTVTTRSSSGCRMDSSTECANSGNSSRNKTPR